MLSEVKEELEYFAYFRPLMLSSDKTQIESIMFLRINKIKNLTDYMIG